MPTVGQIIEQVSFDLLDQEAGRTYVRWPQARLLGYLNDGLAQIALVKPDELVATVTLACVAGERQELPAAYVSLIDVSWAQDDDCGNGNKMSRGEWDAWVAMNLPSCTTPGAPWQGRDWFYNPNMPRMFGVYPPVPQGRSGSVVASVRTQPVVYTTSDYATELVTYGAKYSSALLAWMRYRAYKLDTESATSERDSQDAYMEFRQAMGLSVAADARQGSGWNAGQRGQGDPQASRR